MTTILAFCGSARAGSFNQRVVDAAPWHHIAAGVGLATLAGVTLWATPKA